MIQNESKDRNCGNVCLFSASLVRHNVNCVPYAHFPACQVRNFHCDVWAVWSSLHITKQKPAIGQSRQLEDASTHSHRSNCCGLRGAFKESPRFRSTWGAWTPANSRPRYRRQNARVEQSLLEQLTLFSNVSIVLEDAGTHRSK